MFVPADEHVLPPGHFRDRFQTETRWFGRHFVLTVFLDLVGFSIIFPLFPDMLEYYLDKNPRSASSTRCRPLSGLQGEDAGWSATVLLGGLLGSLYSVLQFVFAPIWERCRIGMAAVGSFPVVTVGGTPSVICCGSWRNPFWLLIASRFLGGLMAGNLSVATAAVADVTDASNRAKGMGMIAARLAWGS